MRSSRSTPSHLLNRFEIRQRVFEQYRDFVTEKDRTGDDLEFLLPESLFDHSPPKEMKQKILVSQLAARSQVEQLKKRPTRLETRRRE